MKKIFLFILLHFLCVMAFSQSFNFRHYQVEAGLANNTVFSCFQDSKGFMWFGTKEGLNRFDGTDFKIFDINLENGQKLKEFVYCIAEGNHGTLFVGTRRGLFEFLPKDEIFKSIGPSSTSEVLTVKTDKRGKVWFTSESKLFCYNEQSGRLREYKLQLHRSLPTASIFRDFSGTLWACSYNGFIFRYDPVKDAFICVNSKGPGLIKEVNKIFVVDNNRILVGSIHGLSLLNLETNTCQPLLQNENSSVGVYVRDILEFTPGVYWIATEEGIFILNLDKSGYQKISHVDHNPYSLSDNAVYCLFKDKEEGIWCGTYFGGLNYFHKQQNFFKNYFENRGQLLSKVAVRELCPDHKGHLWIGTENNGLDKLNLKTGIVDHFMAPETVSSVNIHALMIDDEKLWVGTFQQGLDVFDLRTEKRINHYNSDPEKNGLNSNFIISSLKTSKGKLLFGTANGIYQFDKEMNKFSLAEGFPGSIYVFSLCQGKDGTIWAGTIGHGLFYFNPISGHKGNYIFDGEKGQGLSSNSVCGLFEDSHGNMWISTEGGGLCKLSYDRKSFIYYNTDSGLPSNMVYKVLEDKSGKLWISTSRGLALLNPVNNTFKIFTKENGLVTDQFNYSSGYYDDSVSMYFGSIKGLISFNPDSLNINDTPPKVYITDIEVNHRPQRAGMGPSSTVAAANNSISLKYFQSSLTIGFAALTYITPKTTSYAYKLDGLDESWTFLDINRKVYFNSLSPGDYVFRVKAASGGNWSDKETRIFISIAPPWWKSNVAYVVYLVAAILMLFFIIRTYHLFQKRKSRRRLEKFEREKEKEVYHAKIEFFTNVAHEIRTPLTLIKAPLEIAIDASEGYDDIKRNLFKVEKNTERLIDLTNQLLDFRKTEKLDFKLSFVKVNVVSLTSEIFKLFEPPAKSPEVTYALEKPEMDFYAYIDQEAFVRILSNMIGNAVKYAKNFVSVSIPEPQGGSFSIIFMNDGKLIPLELQEKVFEPFYRISPGQSDGYGIGLALARSLAKLHNGSLEFGEFPVEGKNVFVLTLPVHQEFEFRLGG